MVATFRRGWVDSQNSARLSGTFFLAIYGGTLPKSDGTGGVEIGPATRPSITFQSVAIEGSSGRHYQDNNAVNGIVLTNTSQSHVVGYGICSAATGATLAYFDVAKSPYPVAAGATINLPAGAFRMYAEPPTI